MHICYSSMYKCVVGPTLWRDRCKLWSYGGFQLCRRCKKSPTSSLNQFETPEMNLQIPSQRESTIQSTNNSCKIPVTVPNICWLNHSACHAQRSEWNHRRHCGQRKLSGQRGKHRKLVGFREVLPWDTKSHELFDDSTCFFRVKKEYLAYKVFHC